MHCYLINAAKFVMDRWHLEGGLLTWALLTSFALGGALLLVDGVRRSSGPRSLYVIGSVDERRSG